MGVSNGWSHSAGPPPVEDAEWIAAAREHVFRKYRDVDDEAEADGDEQSALIEIEIGSAAS